MIPVRIESPWQYIQPWPSFLVLIVSLLLPLGTFAQQYSPGIRYLLIEHDPRSQVDAAILDSLLSLSTTDTHGSSNVIDWSYSSVDVSTLPDQMKSAVELLELREFNEAHRILNRHLRRFPDTDAEVYYLDALALMGIDEPGGRNLAEERIRTAVRRNPSELRYKLTLASILNARTLGRYAKDELDKILAEVPSQTQALALKGRLLIETYWALSWQAGGWGIDVTQSTESIEEIRTEGLEYLNQALICEPSNKMASWYLGVDAVLSRDWVYTVRVMTYLVQNGGSGAAYLGRGMALQHLNYPVQAWEDYQKGIEQLDASSRSLINSEGWVIRPSEGGFGTTSDLEHAAGLSDTTFVLERWRHADPLLATPINERLLEQYRRFAFVLWRYSDPESERPGWDTDMGRVYLRYGRPEVEVSYQGGIRRFMARSLYSAGTGGLEQSDTKGIPLLSTVRWAYPGLMVTYGGGYVTGNQTLWPADQEDSPALHVLDSKSDFDRIAEVLPEIPRSIGVVKVKQIESSWYHFESSQGEQEYIPSVWVPFEVFNYRELRSGTGAIPIKIFLLDEGWSDIKQTEVSISAIGHRTFAYNDAGIPIYLPTISTDQQAFFTSIEIVPLYMNPAYVGRDTLELTAVEGLRVSSLVPIKSITEESAEVDWPSGTYFRRGDVLMQPLERDETPGGNLVILYVEVYGLSKDSVGATDYEIGLTISEVQTSDRRGSFLQTLSSLLGGEQDEGSVTLSWQRFGISTNTVEQLPIMMPETDTLQKLRLTIRITDRVLGTSTETSLTIQVVPAVL